MSQNVVEAIVDLGSLPFHVGETESPSNGALPDVLPFVVGVRRDTGLIVQAHNPGVERYLEQAYRRGSIIGTPMASGGIGRRYAEDFLGFILRALDAESLRGLRVLEIGCGSGYLLSRLKELGAEVLGIEPGEQGQVGARVHGVEIIRDVFPSERVPAAERFDVILTYAVAEHVTDPVRFFELQTRHLDRSGRLIFSVPDCSECISVGDISMFLHEHWSYFSPASLNELVRLVGLRLLRQERSGYGGALYGLVGESGDSAAAAPARDESALFQARVKGAVEGARRFFGEAARGASPVGIFCAARAINLLHVLGRRDSIRFFDDDPRLHGKFYPPFAAPVESRAALLSRPVEELVIMSWSFGQKLKAELGREESLKQTRISLPDEVLGSGPS
jgi:2-polyprenyl-3-methyl-5-hydroxy-6-metoxy-1,4-benzoquinol methylase